MRPCDDLFEILSSVQTAHAGVSSPIKGVRIDGNCCIVGTSSGDFSLIPTGQGCSVERLSSFLESLVYSPETVNEAHLGSQPAGGDPPVLVGIKTGEIFEFFVHRT